MTETPIRYGDLVRGVSSSDVSQAADSLLRVGERPTVERVRAAIGSGSPNTIGPLLDSWWKRLAGRLDAGPAAFHRLPESVAHVAEALWLQALEEGRRRALLEQRMTDRALAQDRERLEVRSHVLTLREGELDARLKDRERDIEELRLRLRALDLMTRKDKATIDSQARRVKVLEAELLSLNAVAASQPRKSRTTARKVLKKAKRQPSQRSKRVKVRRMSSSRTKPKRRR